MPNCPSSTYSRSRASGDDRDDTDVQLVAYDAKGEVIGMIGLWVEADDGHAQTVVVDGIAQTEATLPPETIAPRVAAMLGTLDILDTRGPGVAKTIFAGAACLQFAISCPFGAYWAACECLPLVMEGNKCPDW